MSLSLKFPRLLGYVYTKSDDSHAYVDVVRVDMKSPCPQAINALGINQVTAPPT